MTKHDALAVALERCTNEAIELVGAIQSHGVLIALDGRRVAMVSANASTMFGMASTAMLGCHAGEILGPLAESQVFAAEVRGELSPSVPTFLDIRCAALASAIPAQIHRTGELTVIEMEWQQNQNVSRDLPRNSFIPVHDSLWSFDETADIESYSAFIADQLRVLTDFDRVLVYRFDDDWNGAVIAESRNDHLPTLNGHRFPSGDIPSQARALYAKNLIRLLADSLAPPIPLIPARNPVTGAPLDMSFSVLRAMSPVHLEYLKNMGVRASVSVSLIVNGRLWGLIACHNREPRQVSFRLRELIEIIGRTASLKLSTMNASQRSCYMSRIQIILTELTRMLRDHGDIGQLVKLMNTEILNLVGADGVAIGIGSQRYYAGVTPNDQQVEALAAWVKYRVSTDMEFHCDCLESLYSPASEFVTNGAGLLAICIKEPFNDYILWFRREMSQTISWAGNPEKSLVIDTSGPRIEPRRSFSAWIQKVRGHSLPWKEQECDVARSLSRSLVEFLAVRAMNHSQQRNEAILESAGEGIIGLDLDGRVRFANAAACLLLGYGSGELLGLDLLDATACGSGTKGRCLRTDCPIIGVLVTGVAMPSREVRFTRSGGGTFPAELVATPIRSGDKLDGVVIVFRDITERRAAEVRRRQSDTVFANAAEAIMVMDAEGLITGVNRAFTEMTGFEQDEVIGKPASLLKSGHHSPEFFEAMWREVLESRFWRGEIWNKRKNGQVFPMWGTVTVVPNEQGEILNFITVFTDISKVKEVEGHLLYLSTYDALTNLPNRMLFADRLRHALLEAEANSERIAIVFIDFDHFKIINDSLGHAVGDRFLITMAGRLSETVRPGDTLARWGGDEFIIILERVQDVSHVADLAGRFLAAVSAPIVLDGKDFIPSASAGISLYPDNGTDPTRLVQAADAAMYRAKHLGRSRIEFFTKELTEHVEQRFRMSSEIRRALIENEFFLVYQPQCQIDTGVVTGLEALIRWRHPHRGIVPPSDFLPIADELGLMEEIGDWVLGAVCRQIRAWGPELPDSLRISVNVAPCQLHLGFIEKVSKTLEEYHVSYDRIEVEVTENQLDNKGKSIELLSQLRSLGVLVSLDDFGSGYSSLGRLRDMPIDKFKIDKSFVDELPHSVRDLAIIKAIIALGISMNVSVIAEGVEEQSQLGQLQGVGVTVIQGYVFSKPLAAPDVISFIIDRQRQRQR